MSASINEQHAIAFIPATLPQAKSQTVQLLLVMSQSVLLLLAT